MSEKLPSLPLPHPSQAYSSGSSPRVGSVASSVSSHAGSQSSFTSAASSNGPKTPSPTLPITAAISGQPGHSGLPYDPYSTMSQGPDMYYSQHMSGGQATAPQTVTSGTMSHYNPHQPPLLQPGPAQYPAPTAYSQYGYNGLTSPPSAPPVSNPMSSSGLLPPPPPLPAIPGQGPGIQNQFTPGFDTTGQVAPPGMKPRVTATLWEDEGSLCFQVEARGICVARREDNHMINGTKLLNVAGMTRGRRDGILKSEKIRHVVKIGPMHLKGVWIPFERALDFANKEKITELLYPLFVHNIGALLYHPTNQTRASQVMAAAAERRKQEATQLRGGQPAPQGLPSIQQHHSMALPGPQPSLPSHGSVGRPPMERSHTFPTPPTSASSVIGSMAPSDGFQWSQQQGMSGAQATTPPGSNMPNLQSYQSGTSYDSSRQLYNAPSSNQSPYQAPNGQSQDRSMYAPSNTYVKSEMGPPSGGRAGSGDQADSKPPNGILSSDQGGQPVPHPGGEEEADHEHDAEYTHDPTSYDASRPSYNYPTPAVGPLSAEHPHLSPEMTGSPNHHPASGRATPRTAAAPQPYYPQQSGYSTPPRVPSASNNLYNVINNDRAGANGAPGSDVYAPQPDMGGSMANGYAAQAPVMNGGTTAIKRGRDDEDELPRPSSGGPGMGYDLKRRKTTMDSSVPAPAYDAMNRPGSAIAAQRRSLII